MHYTIEEFRDDIRKIVAETIRETKTVSKEPVRPEYLTRQQVKEQLHVSYPTLHRFNKEGILTARKIGGKVLYLFSDVEQAISQDDNLKYRRSKNSSFYR